MTCRYDTTRTASSTTMATVTGSVYSKPTVPAATRTTTIASGPYATEDSASSESAARPSSVVSRYLSSCSATGTGGSCTLTIVHTSTCAVQQAHQALVEPR